MHKNKNATAEPRIVLDGVSVFCAYDEIVEVSKLKPHPQNPNQHPESQIELLGRIIRETGWRAPITVSTLSGLIIKGHGRLESAKAEGMTRVPVEYQKFKSTDEELAALVADNRLAELSEIDNKMLADVFKDIDAADIPVDLTGYKEEDFKDILEVFSHVDATSFDESANSVDHTVGQDLTGEDFKSVGETHMAHKCPRCGFEFD